MDDSPPQCSPGRKGLVADVGWVVGEVLVGGPENSAKMLTFVSKIICLHYVPSYAFPFIDCQQIFQFRAPD